MTLFRFTRCFMTLICLLFISGEAFSQDFADSFQYPLDVYDLANCQDYGHLRSSTRVHTGQDVNCRKAHTPVKAIAAGKVLFAQPRGSVCDNWGYVLVIEHTTRFGKLNSIYGHINNYVSEGQTVSKGDIIGEIADFTSSTNCGWTNHLHFGIYNGAFGAGQGVYPSWLNGYLDPNTFPGKYLRPSDFLDYQIDVVTNPSWSFYDRSGKNDRAKDLINSQGWTTQSGATTVGFNPPGAWILKVANDPQIISPPTSIDASYNKSVNVNIASLASNTQAQVFFATDTSPDFSETKSKFVGIVNDGSYNTYNVSFADNIEWKGKITRIRVDPVAGGNGNEVVGIQWITVTPIVITPSPVGSVTVKATLNGPNDWSGPVDYDVLGPQGIIIGNAVPGTTHNLPPGQYTLKFKSGGPDSLVSITPSETLSLNANSTITFTMNFGGTGGGVDEFDPLLSITSPSDNETVSTNTVTVSGTATDAGNGESGISEVLVNGVRASGDTAVGAETAYWSRSITLNEGVNNIVVEAKDGSSNQNSTTRTITVTLSSPEGDTNVPVDLFWRYRQAMSVGRWGSSVAVLNKKIHVLGGSNVSSSHFVYDPLNNSWEQKASLPGNGIIEGAAAVLGSKIYALGNTEDTRMRVYDPASNEWTTRSATMLPAPQKIRGHAMVAAGEKIYVMGGLSYNDSEPVNSMRVYDPATDSWTNKTPMLAPKAYMVTAVVNDLIYVIGGYDGHADIKDTVDVYDPSTDSWTTKSPMPIRNYIAAVAVIGSRIYVLGGGTGSYPRNSVYEYDTVADSWREMSPLQTARFFPIAGVVNNKVYVIGGSNDGDLSSVEEGSATLWAPALSLTPKSRTNYTPEFSLMSLTISRAQRTTTTVELYSSNSSVARVPATYTILAGETMGQFLVENLSAGGPVTITAKLPSTLGGVSDKATATVINRPPGVETAGVSSVTSTGATVSGKVYPNGVTTNAWFDVGTSPTLESYSSTPAQLLDGGQQDQEIRAGLTGLSAETAYYYRIVASSVGGTQKGSILSFTTPSNPKVAIGGRISIGITGLGGVTVKLTGTSSVTALTDSTGNYKFADLPAGGNYTVTPSKLGYLFTPATRTFTGLTGSQLTTTFSGAARNFDISGRVLGTNSQGVGGISVNLSGARSASVLTDGTGAYLFSNLPAGGNYTVKPSKTAYTIRNSSNLTATYRSYTYLSGNQVNQNFTARALVLSIKDTAITEANSGTMLATFIVNLSAAADKPVSISYRTINGTALATRDYQATSGKLTFNPGQTSQKITVQVIGDKLDEVNEIFQVNILYPINATIGDSQAIGTITDNDLPPSLTISNAAAITEPDSGVVNATFIIKLSAASGRPVTIKYATGGGTATSGTDYTAVPLTSWTFAPGQTTKTVAVQVKGDLVKELNESFFVNLSGALNSIIADSQGLGTILNDD